MGRKGKGGNKSTNINKGEKMQGVSGKPDDNESHKIAGDIVNKVIDDTYLKINDLSTLKDSDKQVLEGGDGLQETTSDDDEVLETNDSSKTQVSGDIGEFKPDGNSFLVQDSENSDGDVATKSTTDIKEHELSPLTFQDDSSDKNEHQSRIEVKQGDSDKSVTNSVDLKELSEIEKIDSDENIGSDTKNRQSVESNGGENSEVSSTNISEEKQLDNADLVVNNEESTLTSSTPHKSENLPETVKQNKLTGKNFSDGASKDSISLNPNKRVILCITKITTVVLGAVFIASLIS